MTEIFEKFIQDVSRLGSSTRETSEEENGMVKSEEDALSGKIVLDIWGGEQHCEHLARYILPVEDALKMAGHELAADFLINLRREVAWGGYNSFDLRFAA